MPKEPSALGPLLVCATGVLNPVTTTVMPARVAIIVTQGFTFPNVSVDARLGDWILRVDSEKIFLAWEDREWAFKLSCIR